MQSRAFSAWVDGLRCGPDLSGLRDLTGLTLHPQGIRYGANQPKAKWRYQAPLLGYVLLANAGALALALSARKKPYFAVDLKISRALQSFHASWFDRLMSFMFGWQFLARTIREILLLGASPLVERQR